MCTKRKITVGLRHNWKIGCLFTNSWRTCVRDPNTTKIGVGGLGGVVNFLWKWTKKSHIYQGKNCFFFLLFFFTQLTV